MSKFTISMSQVNIGFMRSNLYDFILNVYE